MSHTPARINSLVIFVFWSTSVMKSRVSAMLRARFGKHCRKLCQHLALLHDKLRLVLVMQSLPCLESIFPFHRSDYCPCVATGYCFQSKQHLDRVTQTLSVLVNSSCSEECALECLQHCGYQ